jgi:1,4-alpha-glucan branching enzyme
MIQKTFSKKGTSCKVTFRVPGEEVQVGAAVLGDFNDWNVEANPLVRRKDGTYSTTLTLETGRTYRFRYLIDSERWLNDPDADKLVANRFGSLDSLLEL